MQARYIWTSSMVNAYVHNSELQRRWAFALLAKYPFRGDEKILDIGCGDGKITADLALLVPRGSVRGEDPSEEMIRFAKNQFHPIEYPRLSFDHGASFQITSDETYDLIVSFCALQFSKDPLHDLLEMKRHLKPGGKLLIGLSAPRNAAWLKTRKEMLTSPTWGPYYEGFEISTWHTAEEWEEFLKKAKLKPLRIEKIDTMDPFIDKKEYIQWSKAVFPPLIPKEKQDSFFEEFIDRYLVHDPTAINSEGVIFAKFGRIEIEAEHG